MTSKSFLIILIVFLVITSLVTAEIPQVINYQGNLTGSDGTPSDGSFLIKFIIYDAATGGNELWNSGFLEVIVTNGLFEVMLGDTSMPPLPNNLFSTDTTRYLGIKIGTDPVISPRIKFSSVACAYQSLRADSAGYAATADIANTATVATSVTADAVGSTEIVDGSITASDINNTSVQQRVTGTAASGTYITGINADGSVVTSADQVGAGDITAVNTGSGLTGGGTSGAVTLSVPTGGITSTHIYDNTITDADISNSANIATTKISGTAVNLSSDQHITGLKSFGDAGPYYQYQLRIRNNYSVTSQRWGLYSQLYNSSAGNLVGIHSRVDHTEGVTGNHSAIGVDASAWSDGDWRYGFYGTARPQNASLTTGSSYGVYAGAYWGDRAIGVYGTAGNAATNWAGYFWGDVYVNGTITKSGGSFQIDHPLDPENKYLFHSFVESPDMMNVYNGNIVTDINGDAVVKLPDYFDALNKDFRYQLTVIGDFAQAIISEEINRNSFKIKTSKPNIKVSWQVTGIRHDKWAEAHRIQVEVDKPNKEKGLYLHPEAYGLSEEMSIDYKRNLAAERSHKVRER